MEDRLYRSRDERMVAGVCGGLADRFDLDPSIVRVGWTLLTLLTGIFPFLIIYIVMMIVVPEEPPGVLDSLGVAPQPGTPGAAAWDAARAGERAARRSARRSARRARGDRGGNDQALVALVGLGLVVVGAALLFERWFRIEWAVLWPLAVVALGVLVILAAIRR